jgi:hypothetical protein
LLRILLVAPHDKAPRCLLSVAIGVKRKLERENYRLGLSGLVKNIYSSNEFLGSANARENAAGLLKHRWPP